MPWWSARCLDPELEDERRQWVPDEAPARAPPDELAKMFAPGEHAGRALSTFLGLGWVIPGCGGKDGSLSDPGHVLGVVQVMTMGIGCVRYW